MKKYQMGSAVILSCIFQVNIAQADMGQEMLECRKVPSIPDRVICYDKIADQLNQIVQDGQKNNVEIIVQPQPSAKTRERSVGQKFMERFGLKEPEGDLIILEVKRIKFGPRKQFMIFTTNGQAWVQIDNQRVNLPKRLPYEITIKRGSMESFFLYAKGQKTHYRVKRVK